MLRSTAFAAHVICENMLSLSEVAETTEGGKHYPLMLITLQNINKNLGKTALISLFDKSSVSVSSELENFADMAVLNERMRVVAD